MVDLGRSRLYPGYYLPIVRAWRRSLRGRIARSSATQGGLRYAPDVAQLHCSDFARHRVRALVVNVEEPEYLSAFETETSTYRLVVDLVPRVLEALRAFVDADLAARLRRVDRIGAPEARELTPELADDFMLGARGRRLRRPVPLAPGQSVRNCACRLPWVTGSGSPTLGLPS